MKNKQNDDDSGRAPCDCSNWEKAKTVAMYLSLIAMGFYGYGFLQISRDVANTQAYHAASQNVMNRFIGRLEGKQSEEFQEFSKILRQMQKEINEQHEENRKQRGLF